MTLIEVINEFKSMNKLSKLLGIARQNLTQWQKNGYIPALQQLHIEKITNGKLKAEYDHAIPKDYDNDY
jgi:DNA-binding transcriptional regulator YdaS (Cro superfamily)